MNTLFDYTSPFAELQHAYTSLVDSGRRLRRRELAAELNLTEAELTDAQLGCKRLRLKDNFPQLVEQLHRLGPILTLTRNEAAVHERKGHYPHAHIQRPVGLVIGNDRKIDLRLLFNHWHQGFAVAEALASGMRYSLQFFDKYGVAVQKIFLQPDTHFEGYFQLLEQFRAEDQKTPLAFEPQQPAVAELADSRVDIRALTRSWSSLSNEHQFFGLLKEHGVSRQQAFRLVGAPWAEPVALGRIKPLLEQAARDALPLMCFVGSRGNIQIHSGPINRVKMVGNWLNVLDPEFNLHLDMERIASAWLVRKPSRDGTLTSLELYTDNGNTAAQFLGVRQPGKPESNAWRQLAESTLKPERACA